MHHNWTYLSQKKEEIKKKELPFQPVAVHPVTQTVTPNHKLMVSVFFANVNVIEREILIKLY